MRSDVHSVYSLLVCLLHWRSWALSHYMKNSTANPVKDKSKWSYKGEQHNAKHLYPYSGRFPHTPDDSPKSSIVGALLPKPSPFCEDSSVSGHQKSRKGTNPIRLNDAIPSFLPIGRSIFVYTAPYSDVLSVQICKHNHPSFVSKLRWLYVSAPIYWYKLQLPVGQIQGVRGRCICTPLNTFWLSHRIILI